MAGGWARFAHRFGQYYRSSEFWTPPRLKSREWMFIPFGGAPPIRHKSFQDMQGVRNFITERAMHSCFYSTAYWKRPYELKMADKGWQGADLIFDLDGDHLPGVHDRDFPGMLDLIRDQAWTLWNDFLEPEFGFDEKYLQVTFSGHRGFHLHYRDPALFHLDSEARRELVSHIRGEGVDVQYLNQRWDDDSAHGWSARIKKSVPMMLDKLDRFHNKTEGSNKELNVLLDALKKQATREGKDKAKGKTSVLNLAEWMSNEKRREYLLEGMHQSLGNHQQLFFDLIKADNSVVLGNAGETDEVVTIDTRRQIRWPTSLHGKSGMRVSEFPLSRLDPDSSNRYDPLKEALALSVQDELEVEVIVDEARVSFLDREYDLSMGDKFSIHEAGATFLVLKNWAKLV